MYFKGPIWFCKVRKKKLVDFSGSLKMKILALKDKNFHFTSPLKHIRFFKVREKKANVLYFSKFGSTKVHEV